jgi:hypothetical protein
VCEVHKNVISVAASGEDCSNQRNFSSANGVAAADKDVTLALVGEVLNPAASLSSKQKRDSRF